MIKYGNIVFAAPLPIAFVLPSLSAGGAERVLISLMNGLDRTRFSPCFITAISKGSLRSLIAPDIPIYDLHARGVIQSLPRLYKNLAALQPEIVVSTIAHMNFALLLLKPFFPKTKFFVREAIVPSFIFQSRPLLAPAIRFAYKILYKTADTVLSPSQVILDEFKNLPLNQEKQILLYNPVNTALIEQELQTSVKLRGAVKFVASGRLHPQKGFDRLIKALHKYRHKFNHSWHLSILGEGEQRAELVSLIEKLNMNDVISLLGHQQSPWPYYAAADCLLLPSRWEGLPNVVLESLACGTPVIATRESGGIAEIANQSNGEVKISSTMDDFIQMAMAIQPGTNNQKSSLLPRLFQQEQVQKQFETLLLQTI